MQIDRQMVSLFFEIKRSLPRGLRERVKLSSPGIGQHLVIIHTASNNLRLKNLIERFLRRAGACWINRITPLDKANSLHFVDKQKLGEQITHQQ